MVRCAGEAAPALLLARPAQVTARSGASGPGPAKSVFKPSYFVKYGGELTKTGEADGVKQKYCRENYFSVT